MKTLINKIIGKYVVLYIVLTYVLYLILPRKNFHTSDLDESLTIFFLLLVCIAFYFGCKSTAIIKRKHFYNCNKPFYINHFLLSLLLIIVVSDLWLYLSDLVFSGAAQLSFAMGDNYRAMIENEQSLQRTTWGRLFVLLAPIRILLLSYSVYRYKTLSIINKLLLIIMILSFVSIGFFRGQQVDFGTIAIYTFIPLYIYSLRNGSEKKVIRGLKWVIMTFVIFFVFSQLVRAEAFSADLGEDYDTDSIIFKLFGERIGYGLCSLMMYFSHGYKGLNYSLQLPFEWTYGYGGSRALDQYLTQYLNFRSMYHRAYPMRVNEVFHYDCEMSWPTAFAWLASDFTFPGLIVVMFFLGILICSVFKDAYYKQNIYAISFLSQLSIMIVFLPLNNQIFQARDSLIASFVLCFLWLISKNNIHKSVMTTPRK